MVPSKLGNKWAHRRHNPLPRPLLHPNCVTTFSGNPGNHKATQHGSPLIYRAQILESSSQSALSQGSPAATGLRHKISTNPHNRRQTSHLSARLVPRFTKVLRHNASWSRPERMPCMRCHNQPQAMPKNSSPTRRRIVQSLGATLLAPLRAADTDLRVAGKAVEIQLTSVSPHTFRLTVQPIVDGKLADIPDDGTLLHTTFGAPAAKLRGSVRAQTVKLGDLRVAFTPDPLAIAVTTASRARPYSALRSIARPRSSPSPPAPLRFWGWAKAVRSSTAAATPSAWRAARAGTTCATSAAAFPSRG